MRRLACWISWYKARQLFLAAREGVGVLVLAFRLGTQPFHFPMLSFPEQLLLGFAPLVFPQLLGLPEDLLGFLRSSMKTRALARSTSGTIGLNRKSTAPSE